MDSFFGYCQYLNIIRNIQYLDANVIADRTTSVIPLHTGCLICLFQRELSNISKHQLNFCSILTENINCNIESVTAENLVEFQRWRVASTFLCSSRKTSLFETWTDLFELLACHYFLESTFLMEILFIAQAGQLNSSLRVCSSFREIIYFRLDKLICILQLHA